MSIPEAISTTTESTHHFSPGASTQPRRVRVEIAGRTDAGRVRENNEDHFLIARLAKSMQVLQSSLRENATTHFSDEEGYLMIVADGMGGAAAGERASAVAVKSVEEFALNTFKWFLHLGGQEEHVLLSELREGLERADREVIRRAQDDPVLRGMGTTLTMAYSVATDLFVVHAGDSRAYLFREGELAQLTSDHTLVQLLVKGGGLSPEQAKHHSRRNVITNVIGGPHEGVYAEIHKLVLLDGDTLLLSTDGLTDPVENAALAEILARYPEPGDACQRLIELALDRGGPDNVTAVVARYQIEG